MSQEQKDWDEHISRFLLAYRFAVHDSTYKSPTKVIFRTEINPPGDLEFGVKLVTVVMSSTLKKNKA